MIRSSNILFSNFPIFGAQFPIFGGEGRLLCLLQVWRFVLQKHDRRHFDTNRQLVQFSVRFELGSTFFFKKSKPNCPV